VLGALVVAAAIVATVAVAASRSTSGGAAISCRGPEEAAPAAGRCIPGPDLRVLAAGTPLEPTWRGGFPPRGPAGWNEVQAVSRTSIRGVRAASGTRPHVGVFTVRPGDTPVRSGERAEVAASEQDTGGGEGTEAWYVWSTLFPRGAFRPVPGSTLNIFTQWHGTAPDGCRPNVALQVNTNKSPPQLRLGARGGRLAPGSCAEPHDNSWDFAPLETGRWHDFALHVRWSSDPRRGFVELFLGGRVVVPRSAGATLYAGQRVYAKQGFYRAPASFTTKLVHSGMTRLGAAGAKP
jgi:hypothetical protein